MAKSMWMKSLVCVFSAGAITAASSVLAQEDVLVPTTSRVEYQVQPRDLRFTRPGNVLYLVADAEKATEEAKAAHQAESEYWLGVQIAELPEVAKQQLGIDQGLVVEEVMPDSPAAKAEIRKHDILVKAGDTPLKEPSDLGKSVEASKGKEMTIAIVRGGKDRTVKVTAAKRPEKERFAIRTARPPIDAEIKRLEEALDSLKSKAGKEGFGLWLARPGVVQYQISPFPKGPPGDFPKDLTVRIVKEGDQPTKIHVQRGDKEWDITEDKQGVSLRDLPEEIRTHVLQFLRGVPATPGKVSAGTRMLRVTPEGKVEGEVEISPFPPKPPTPPAAPAAPGAPQGRTFTYRAERSDNSSDAKLDALMNEVKQLRKEVEELRSKSPGDKK